jgi:hypothetical protein
MFKASRHDERDKEQKGKQSARRNSFLETTLLITGPIGAVDQQ